MAPLPWHGSPPLAWLPSPGVAPLPWRGSPPLAWLPSPGVAPLPWRGSPPLPIGQAHCHGLPSSSGGNDRTTNEGETTMAIHDDNARSTRERMGLTIERSLAVIERRMDACSGLRNMHASKEWARYVHAYFLLCERKGS